MFLFSFFEGRYNNQVNVVQHCCVPLCDYFKGKTRKYGKRISLFNFPQTKNEKRQWLAGIRRDITVEDVYHHAQKFVPKMLWNQILYTEVLASDEIEHG